MESVWEMVSKTRRSSDRFMRLTECFERSEMGVKGEEELSELLGENIEMADKKHQHFSKFNNFTDILAKFSQGGSKFQD